MPWKIFFLFEYDTKKEALIAEIKIKKYDMLGLKKKSKTSIKYFRRVFFLSSKQT